ncbi:hypothetical protein PFISCL1PPCAC_24067 [Pristionchus fissidentatus]|uniref:Conserved oligomeric Golgi complex subunit 6 n=1 Tax=Pristionchus fissidentatus TaxID=1538716 RepID=A0AAV5WQA5_9BILA|nr:hypothetical protein PFISCL1PPCAC_24067 [Pristionchus fissidentatus]
MENGESEKTAPASFSSSNPAKKKIDKLISSKIHNDPAFAELMDYVSPIVSDIDIHTERRLMRKLEQRELDLNKEYLKEFEMVNKHVQTFSEKVNDMHKICADLTDQIQQNKEKTQDLLNKTSALQNRKKVLELKQKAIDDFLAQFSLTEAEEKALEGNSDGRISSDFFPALERARSIYEQSKQLLRTSANHAAAMGVMEEMSKKMEAAYDVLYRSIQRECRVLNTEMIEVKGVIAESFAALKDRQVLLKYALDDYANARKNNAMRAFSDILTRGAGGGKPLEVLAHDPLRYTGDMLAWTYECIGNEKEILTLMLSKCPPELIREHEQRVLSLISSQLARTFKVRVEQTLTGEHESTLLYKLVSILAFYSSKIEPIVGSESDLVHTIEELQQLTLNIFFSGLNQTVHKILSRMGTPDYDLLPVQAVHQSLMLLKEVLDIHDSTSSGGDEAKNRFEKMVSSVIDPLYRSVQLAATQLHSPVDMSVYTINCLSSVHSLLILYPFTDKRLEVARALMEGHEDTLISEEASAILSSTSLIPIYQKAMAHNQSQGPLSSISDADAATVKRALEAFDNFLAQPHFGRIDQVARISNIKVRERVHSRTMDNVVAAYSVIQSKLVDPFNKYEGLEAKTVEQVRDLLK